MKALLRCLPLCLLLIVPLSVAQAQAPLLSPIANVSLNAGSTMNVNVVAVDELGRPISITAALPPFATLNTPTVGTGVVVTTLTLAPSSAHVGDFTAAVTATAGGVPSVRVFQITVNATGSDQAPRVTVLPLHEITAGSKLNFAVNAIDPDGDGIFSLLASGLPPGATFIPNTSNRAGMFDWTPSASDAGEYDIQFTASNDLSGAAVAHVRVASPPALAITPISDVTVAGGATLSVPVHASGVPGASITLTAALPTFATLNPPGTGTSEVNTTVTLAPPVGSAGTYHASITAISLGVSVSENFDITVTGPGQGNRAPQVTAPAAASVAVGSTLSFNVTATDPDGDPVELIDRDLPPGSSFVDNGNNTGTFTWSPVAGQVGLYEASFTGMDNRGGTSFASTMITVTDVTPENHAPTLSAPATELVAEGVHIAFTVSASDEDGDHVTLSPDGALPSGAAFVDQGNNTGSFSWTPGATQSGTYVVTFLGNDGNGGTGAANTTITVTDVAPENRAPTLSAPSTRQVDENVHIEFTVTGTDPDGDHVALSTNAVPAGATFTDQGNNTGTFSWTPSSSQSGNHVVTFFGNDGNGGSDTASTSITVRDAGGGEVVTVPGKACLIGKFKHNRKTTCFRIKPVDRSFALTDVVLSSIRLRFNGDSVVALDGAQIERHCHHGRFDNNVGMNLSAGHNGRDRDGRRDDDDDDDDGGGRHDKDWCNVSCSGHSDCKDHGDDDDGGGHGDDDDDDGGGGHGDDDDDDGGGHVGADDLLTGRHRGGSCDTLGIRVCFSTETLLRLFGKSTMTALNGSSGRKHLPCALVDAEILATLTNGSTVVATFGDRDHRATDGGGDDAEGSGAKDAVDQGDSQVSRTYEDVLGPSVKPNPLTRSTELSFTMARDSRVHVAVYDMQGRLVKKLLNDFRMAGQQRLTWDGSNERSVRVPAGVYFIRIHSQATSAIQRVTVVN